MATLMATATCTAFRAVLEDGGQRVGQRVLCERVGFLAGLPVTHRPEELLPAGERRLSRETCRQRTHAAERTGFHHVHATEVHPLTPRFGPHGTSTRPRHARKA